jgi:hypothetical protein
VTVLRSARLTSEAVERLRDAAHHRPSAPRILTLNILSNRGVRSGPRPGTRSATSRDRQAHDVFSIGPAGTGTSIASRRPCRQQVNRYPDRPAVEAERLASCPARYEKIDPYLRLPHDALHDMIDPSRSCG